MKLIFFIYYSIQVFLRDLHLQFKSLLFRKKSFAKDILLSQNVLKNFCILLTMSFSHMTYSQISGHYVLNKQENETIQFDIEIRYESAKNIIVPPISFKSHKVLYRAKLLGVHSLAQNSKSFHQVLSYSYLLNQIQGLTEIPKFTIRYLLDSKEKYFEIKAFSLKEAKPESNQFWFILLPLLLALFAVFILKKKNKSQEKSLKVDLKTLWQSGKTTEFYAKP
ncbi:hypothetical protein MJH12_20085 [bacterium]|nr:hypothetical protein [bacterium]